MREKAVKCDICYRICVHIADIIIRCPDMATQSYLGMRYYVRSRTLNNLIRQKYYPEKNELRPRNLVETRATSNKKKCWGKYQCRNQ